MSKKKKVRFADQIYIWMDKIQRGIIHVFDELYTPILERVAWAGSGIVSTIIGLFDLLISSHAGRTTAVRYTLSVLKVVFGFPIAILISVIVMLAVLIGGTFASILGMRNLGDYSAFEQFVAWLPLFLLALFIPRFASDFAVYFLSLACIFTIIIMGLDLLYGHCGILTLGHSSFVLIGGFFTAWFYNGAFGFQVPYFFSVLMAAVVTAVFGFVLGLPALRIRDQYLVIVTLAFTHAVPMVLKSKYLADLSGFKSGGLQLASSVAPPAFLSFIPNDTWYFYCIIVATLFLMFAKKNIVHNSQIGRMFRLIKCDSEIASILGVPVVRYKLMAFAMSAFFAAVGGGLFLLIIPFIGIDSYTAKDSMDYLVGTTAGGSRTILGSMLGGIFLAGHQKFSTTLAEVIPRGQAFLSVFEGVLLILVTYLVPDGLAGFLTNWVRPKFQRAPRRWQYYLSPPPDYDPLSRVGYRAKNEVLSQPEGE